LIRAGEVGIQVRRGRKALRFTGHDRKAKRLAWPVTSGKRGIGNFCTRENPNGEECRNPLRNSCKEEWKKKGCSRHKGLVIDSLLSELIAQTANVSISIYLI
jgi:hypothetical protein